MGQGGLGEPIAGVYNQHKPITAVICCQMDSTLWAV